MNGTPPRSGNNRTSKIRSATGAHLPGTMRTGRTMENDDLNTVAATGRGQQKNDVSSNTQKRTSGVKTRSPSPAHRPTPGYNVVEQFKGRMVSSAAKHCHECGEAFPLEKAKYCCQCGHKRLVT